MISSSASLALEATVYLDGEYKLVYLLVVACYFDCTNMSVVS